MAKVREEEYIPRPSTVAWVDIIFSSCACAAQKGVIRDGLENEVIEARIGILTDALDDLEPEAWGRAQQTIAALKAGECRV